MTAAVMETSEFRCCAIVPTYDNPVTIRSVVEGIRVHLPDVLVVDDGSDTPGREACRALARDGLATVIRLEKNVGKGAAVRRAFLEAEAAGFSHAFQIDADGQHDLEEIPAFLAAASENSRHAIFGAPVYDGSVPRIRFAGRKITRFWVDLEVGRGVIQDAMIGFRVYPIEQVRGLALRDDRMAFDVEIAVLLVWAGVKVLNVPVAVRYPSAEEGGLSHFRPIADNVRLSWLHARLCTSASIRWCLGWLPRSAALKRS
jgi:glycosyltransferase involved in cell wall biosynthesis